MVTMTCPWCEEEALLRMIDPEEPEAAFTCADCGTSVTLAQEPAAAPDLAA